MTGAAHYTVNAPMVVHETIDNEVVIINLDSGCYYSLQGLGAAVWELVKEQTQVAEIINTITASYNGQAPVIEGAVSQLLADLQYEHLIVPTVPLVGDNRDTAQVPVTVADDVATALNSLKLQKYTDMQEMMLLDPIHDVTETGWPERLPDRPAYVD